MFFFKLSCSIIFFFFSFYPPSLPCLRLSLYFYYYSITISMSDYYDNTKSCMNRFCFSVNALKIALSSP